jgi:hypothetical protein
MNMNETKDYIKKLSERARIFGAGREAGVRAAIELWQKLEGK